MLHGCLHALCPANKPQSPTLLHLFVKTKGEYRAVAGIACELWGVQCIISFWGEPNEKVAQILLQPVLLQAILYKRNYQHA